MKKHCGLFTMNSYSLKFLAVLVFLSAVAISPLSAAELACYRKQKISNKIKDLNTFQMYRFTYIYIR
jgi:uncharacterized membrane protein